MLAVCCAHVSGMLCTCQRYVVHMTAACYPHASGMLYTCQIDSLGPRNIRKTVCLRNVKYSMFF